MNIRQDIVVTNLNISQKEEQQKQRFFTNTKPTEVVAPPPPVRDQGFASFLQELQTTIKQQGAATIHDDLIKKQASIVQQQLEFMTEEQKNFSKVISHLNRPASEDPKKLIAEILAPLSKQISDIKLFYEEAKSTAKETSSQITELKKALSENRCSVHLKNSVDNGFSKFASKKAVFEGKIREIESTVSEAMIEAEDHIAMDKCKSGIDYLRQQIRAVKDDTEKLETELQDRYQRIIQQVHKVKHAETEFYSNTKTEEKVIGLLGGSFDYEDILLEIESIGKYKNQLVVEYKKHAPAFPKFTKPIVVQVAEKIAKKKTAQISGPAERKTLKTKPPVLRNLASQPRGASASRIPSVPAQRVKNYEVEKTSEKKTSARVMVESKATATEIREYEIAPRLFSEKNAEPDFARKTPEIPHKSESVSPRSEHRGDKNQIIKAPSPLPFQTKPGVTKGEQTAKTLTFADIYPSIKSIETQEPPRPTLEQKTVDAVTEFILTSMIKPKPKQEKIIEPQPSKWLGVEELSELTKLGIYVDPLTLDRIGKEVLNEGISSIKMSKKNRTAAAKNTQEFIEEKILEGSEKTSSDKKNNGEFEEKYESDFEEVYENEIKEEAKVEVKNQEKVFDKISPRTPPFLYENRFEKLNTPSLNLEHQESGLESLLDPRLLGRMNAESIQQYVSALIDAGHIKTQNAPSISTRNPTPFTPITASLQHKPASDTTIIEPKIPDELKEFSSSKIGAEIMGAIKENPGLNPQQAIEKWVEKKQVIKYPPKFETPHDKTEAGVFGRPKSYGARLFDVEIEEKKLFEESSAARKNIKIPLLEINRTSLSSDSLRLITDSEVSGLSQSGSIASEIFNIDNPEFMGGFLEYIKKAKGLEEGQFPGNSDLSEGEVRMDEELSSGEIPHEALCPYRLRSEKNEKIRISANDLLSEDDFVVSGSGEDFSLDPKDFFKVS